MESIRVKWRNLSLRRAFALAVFATTGVVALLSVATISGCMRGREYLLPDPESAYLTVEKVYDDGTEVTEVIRISMDAKHQKASVKNAPSDGIYIGEEISGLRQEQGAMVNYSITKAESGYDYLTPKRKMAYQALGAGIIILPAVYAVLGVLVCAFWFYRHKLSLPIERLEYSIGQIRQRNLDFEVGFSGEDELGQVCASFEEMREILYENNQSLWNMLEERKRLQASVAHDLRNPITIIQTYAEYLKLSMSQVDFEEELVGMVDNLQIAAGRLERYTDSIGDISRLEEMEVEPMLTNLAEVLPDMEEELGVLAKKEQKKFIAGNLAGEAWGMADVPALYRILENLVANASRYARETVRMNCMAEGSGIAIRVWDDGPGFPQKVLSGRRTYFTTADQESGHMGMGLAICRILCQKLGGRMELRNHAGGGAEVTIILKT